MLESLYRYFSGGGEEDDDPSSPAGTSEGGAELDDMHASSSASRLSTGDQVFLKTFHDEITTYGNREVLPAVMVQREQISIWSILKQSIGKELSKITMPVIFNEPLSFIQRVAEYMEYAEVIAKAAQQEDPVKRMEWVGAFAVSALACNWDRVAKPFNPLLGETYELDRLADLGFRIVCEQVSHHPPVSAFYAEGPSFRFHGSVYPKLRFWGRSVEAQPKGIMTLELTNRNETYTWNNVSCSVHNLVMGKPYIEQHGIMEIVNHSNGLRCTLNFKPNSSWFGRDMSNHIEGFITDRHKRKLRSMYGEWTSFLASCPTEVFEQGIAAWGKEHKHRQNQSLRSPPASRRHSSSSPDPATAPANHYKPVTTVLPLLQGSELLWRVKPRPPSSDQFYHFTLFAMTLNEWTPGLGERAPGTDSRRRPDMRCMEDGDLDGAADEKHRLEEKQREARAQRKKRGVEEKDWQPRWFKAGKHPILKEPDWIFTGKYWDLDFSACPDIF